MEIIDINPMQNPIWLELLERHNSDVFHSPQWLNVLAETYDFDVRAQVLSNGDNVPRAGIPYIKINDMFSPRTIILPFSDYCDPLVGNMEEWSMVSDDLVTNDQSISIRCLHNSVPLTDSRFEMVNKAKWHGIKLNKSVDEHFQNINSSSRRAIRKAKREGISIRIADSEKDLRAFYEMHLKVRKNKYRLLAQSYRFLKAIWENFVEKGQGVLMLAEHGQDIIAGVLYLKWKNRMYYKFNASIEDSLNIRPNDLLMWEGIEHGINHGYNFLDLGLSDWDQDGLIGYKRKYATDEKTISFLKYLPEGLHSEKEQQMRKVISQLTDLFTDDLVADKVTEEAGDVLYQYFT